MYFLSQLMHEGRSHLQQHLTASVLGRKVFCMPFHRGTQVTGKTLGAMKAALAYCQMVRSKATGHSQLHAPLAQVPGAVRLSCMLPNTGVWCRAVRLGVVACMPHANQHVSCVVHTVACR